jgi:hypothetical protein
LLAGAEPEELATAVTAALRGPPGIALGDVIGANVAICLVALGMGAVIAPLPFRAGVMRYALLGCRWARSVPGSHGTARLIAPWCERPCATNTSSPSTASDGRCRRELSARQAGQVERRTRREGEGAWHHGATVRGKRWRLAMLARWRGLRVAAVPALSAALAPAGVPAVAGNGQEEGAT